MSGRVERIGSAMLYLGRWEDVGIDTSRVDLLLTDPPYGVNAPTKNASKSRGFRPYDGKARAQDFAPIAGDNAPFDPASLLAFKNAVLWGANNYADKLPSSACWFSWDRKAGKAAASDITDCELAWVRGLPFKTVRQFSHMWAGFQRDSEAGDLHLHPSQKPVALFLWCLSFFPKAHVVFDPYMGSSPVGAACIREGREYIGVECEPLHFETALRRLEKEARQPDMFAAPAPKATQPALFETTDAAPTAPARSQ